MSHKARLERAYSVVHGLGRLPGPVKWFRQRLAEAGIKVGSTSVYRYVNGEYDMPPHIEAVLGTCEGEARDILKRQLEQLR